MGKITFPTAPLADPLAQSLGYVNWNYHPGVIASATALTSQTIYATGIYLPFGKVCTGIVLSVPTAGTSTAPTGFFVGLCSATKMLCQSANLSASAGLTTVGMQQFAFNATYTTSPTDSTSGLFYVVVLQNGAFAGTNVAFGRSTGGTAATALAGQALNYATAGTAQTALPANAAAVTLTAGPQAWAVGVY